MSKKKTKNSRLPLFTQTLALCCISCHSPFWMFLLGTSQDTWKTPFDIKPGFLVWMNC